MDRQDIYTWCLIGAVVLASTAGDVLSAQAMQKIGDFGKLRQRVGVGGVMVAVMRSTRFLLAVVFMAVSFFTLMMALSWAEVSLVVPATAALTFLTNAVAAKIFLHEKVDRKRWIAAIFVSVGVALISQ
jgi:drug/metabolite transporter (DMT)-like permease